MGDTEIGDMMGNLHEYPNDVKKRKRKIFDFYERVHVVKYFKMITTEYRGLMSDFKYGLSRFFKYQIGTKLVLSIIAIPILRFFLEMLLKTRGMSSLSNSQLIKFLTTPQGFISFLLLTILAVFIILIELGGLIVLSHQSMKRQGESKFGKVVQFCMGKIPKFSGIGGILVILNLLLFGPLLGLGLHTSVISEIKIPDFIKDFINQKELLLNIYYFLTACIVIISLQWIFSIHYIVLEGQKAIDALKSSARLIKNNFKSFIKYFVGINILNFIVSAIIIVLWFAGLLFIVEMVNYNTGFGKLMLASVTLLQSLGVVAVSFILVPLQVMHLTRLYYYLSKESCGRASELVLEEKEVPTFVDRILSHKNSIMTLLVISFFVFSFAISVVFDEFIDVKYDIEITAHRGSSFEAPENTATAVAAAIHNGADYSEIDVQMTKDNRVVLLHDKTLERTTGLEKGVWELTYEEIAKLDAGIYFAKEFKDERIPSLEEIIDLAKGQIKLNIELKKNGNDQNLADEVVRIIEDKNFVNSCVVTSLDYDILQEVEKLNPDIKTGYIIFLTSGDLSTLNVDFYSIEESNVNEGFVIDAHEIGREVHVWTINNVDDLERLVFLGVDNIITDHEKQFKDHLEMLKREEDPKKKIVNFIFK